MKLSKLFSAFAILLMAMCFSPPAFAQEDETTKDERMTTTVVARDCEMDRMDFTAAEPIGDAEFVPFSMMGMFLNAETASTPEGFYPQWRSCEFRSEIFNPPSNEKHSTVIPQSRTQNC